MSILISLRLSDLNGDSSPITMNESLTSEDSCLNTSLESNFDPLVRLIGWALLSMADVVAALSWKKVCDSPSLASEAISRGKSPDALGEMPLDMPVSRMVYDSYF